MVSIEVNELRQNAISHYEGERSSRMLSEASFPPDISANAADSHLGLRDRSWILSLTTAALLLLLGGLVLGGWHAYHCGKLTSAHFPLGARQLHTSRLLYLKS